jgi:hypothetical protein
VTLSEDKPPLPSRASLVVRCTILVVDDPAGVAQILPADRIQADFRFDQMYPPSAADVLGGAS